MKGVLPIIVVSQFFCTSLWFAVNAVMPEIIANWQLPPGFLAHLTSAVQVGFITGTLVFAVFTLSDRFSPSSLFCFSALLAAVCNMVVVFQGIQPNTLLLVRFLTGFFLAGVYPIGMKIASDYFRDGLGKSLGYLVGALVVGTAFPHLVKSSNADFSWRYIILATSVLAVVGGLTMIVLVPDGPYRQTGQQLKANSFLTGFKSREFRAVAFGYFGHMWELYTFWAFVPVMLSAYNNHYSGAYLNVPLWSFIIIASGGAACVAGGHLSLQLGARRVAIGVLALSCLCCLLSPWFLLHPSAAVMIAFLLFWGLVVIADSPLFSTLVAQNAPADSKGTALTIVTCVGFAITVVSIQVLSAVITPQNSQYAFMLLAIGPVAGLISLLRKAPVAA